ncbi:MAG: hypothetical protein ACK4Z3_00535 [Rhizobium rosettiformans]
MTLNQQIETALDVFWHAAYEQGRDQRDHDDEDGTAQKAEQELRNAISDALVAASTPTPTSHVVPEIDGGRFEEWSLADFAGQCRMQSRDQLDPEFSRFMAALGKRLSQIAPAPEQHMAPILKGIGKRAGDGWKDTTTKGEITFVWNRELPSPCSAGQYPRIGNEQWSASTEQYDFTPASLEEIEALFASPALPPTEAS